MASKRPAHDVAFEVLVRCQAIGIRALVELRLRIRDVGSALESVRAETVLRR